MSLRLRWWRYRLVRRCTDALTRWHTREGAALISAEWENLHQGGARGGRGTHAEEADRA